MKIGG